MANRNDRVFWLLVVVLALCLQTVFVLVDCQQTATGTAIDFSKAYFLLDADMEKYLCGELAGDDDESAASAYLYKMSEESRQRGFGKGMVRQTIYRIHTKTLAQNAKSATIHVEGLRRTCIHPFFAYVAKLFQLGQAHHFEETLELVKEDGCWKICGTPYGLKG